MDSTLDSLERFVVCAAGVVTALGIVGVAVVRAGSFDISAPHVGATPSATTVPAPDAESTSPLQLVGVVVTRSGADVTAGAPGLVGEGELRVRFAVPVELGWQLPANGPVSVRIDDVDVSCRGRVTWIAPQVDLVSGMLVVEAELMPSLEGAKRLIAGLSARVSLRREPIGGAL